MPNTEAQNPNILAMTADIVAEYAATNSVSAPDLTKLIQITHDALSSLGGVCVGCEPHPQHVPAVSVRKSLADPNFIVSLIDGKQYSTLKRHLSSHGLTPADYRQRYGLKPDYPITAPAYSLRRSALAKSIGLGRKPGEKPPVRKSSNGKKRLTPTYR